MTIPPIDRSEREQCLDDVLTTQFRAVDAGREPSRELLFQLHPDPATGEGARAR
ncbi:MAG TPA: hypothetical protein VGP68_02630 [Gemmataceae bacterium]|nr:hypothetical protein [Gemmataceae bacterium]